MWGNVGSKPVVHQIGATTFVGHPSFDRATQAAASMYLRNGHCPLQDKLYRKFDLVLPPRQKCQGGKTSNPFHKLIAIRISARAYGVSTIATS